MTNLLFSDGQHRTGESHCEMFKMTWQVLTLKAVLHRKKRSLSVRLNYTVKSVQSALSDLLTTSATHGTFSRPSTKRGLISIIKLMQFTIVRFF